MQAQANVDLSGALNEQNPSFSAHSSEHEAEVKVRAFALSRHAKAFGFALAVKQGRFQFQTVTFDKRGVSTCKAESPWLSPDDAEQFIYAQESDA